MTIYLVAVALAYVDYRRHHTQWLADIVLVLLTIPFTLLARLVTGGSSEYEVRGSEPMILVPAILLCTILAYGLGALCGRFGAWLRLRLH